MATLTIREVDDDLRQKLRERAARHGRSMEAEVRAILRQALATEPTERFGTRVRLRFADLADLGDRDVGFEPPDRSDVPRAAELP
ncbi:MAG: Arc family DNA-binding protein [Acidimicrobiia bacterium]